MNAQTFFSKEQQQNINQAIAQAEKQTSAEIVPVLADASGTYDRAEDLCGLILAILAVVTFWLLFQDTTTTTAWSDTRTPTLTYHLGYVIATILVFFILGAFLASKVWPLRHLFTPRSLMKQCVKTAAHQAFYEFNLSKTQNATGVLIYISLFERMVYVLGDKTISEKLTDQDFAEIKEHIVTNFQQGNQTQGLCEAIERCGEKLAKDFPIQEDDRNELANELRVCQRGH